MMGVTPSGSGSCPTGGAAGASPAKPSIPNAGFTPGPWRDAYEDDHGQAVIMSAHTEIATCWHHCVGSLEKQMVANARLIAAAPELYEALRQCRLELDYCQQQLAAHGQTGHPEDSVSRALKAGSAALAKARGEQA